MKLWSVSSNCFLFLFPVRTWREAIYRTIILHIITTTTKKAIPIKYLKLIANTHPLELVICIIEVSFALTRASVSSGSKSVNLFRLRLFTCSSTKLKCSSALKHNLSRNDVTTSYLKRKSKRKNEKEQRHLNIVIYKYGSFWNVGY